MQEFQRRHQEDEISVFDDMIGKNKHPYLDKAKQLSNQMPLYPFHFHVDGLGERAKEESGMGHGGERDLKGAAWD
jgi:hypothetical protein